MSFNFSDSPKANIRRKLLHKLFNNNVFSALNGGKLKFCKSGRMLNYYTAVEQRNYNVVSDINNIISCIFSRYNCIIIIKGSDGWSGHDQAKKDRDGSGAGVIVVAVVPFN